MRCSTVLLLRERRGGQGKERKGKRRKEGRERKDKKRRGKRKEGIGLGPLIAYFGHACLYTFLHLLSQKKVRKALSCVHCIEWKTGLTPWSVCVCVCIGSKASHNSAAKAGLLCSSRWSLDQKTSRQISARLQRSERRRKSNSLSSASSTSSRSFIASCRYATAAHEVR